MSEAQEESEELAGAKRDKKEAKERTQNEAACESRTEVKERRTNAENGEWDNKDEGWHGFV